MEPEFAESQEEAESAASRIMDLVLDLVDHEIDSHTRYLHDCAPNCINPDVLEFITEAIPEVQARAMLLAAVKMMAIKGFNDLAAPKEEANGPV